MIIVVIVVAVARFLPAAALLVTAAVKNALAKQGGIGYNWVSFLKKSGIIWQCKHWKTASRPWNLMFILDTGHKAHAAHAMRSFSVVQFIKKWALISALAALVGIFLAVTPALAAPVTVPAKQKSNLSAPVLPGGALLGSARTYPYRDGYAFVSYGAPMNHALLSVAQTRLYQARMGSAPSEGIFEVDIRLYNDSGDQRSVYNVDWDRLLPLAGCLALYDAQKHYVCDLEDNSMGGSSTGVSANDWLAVPASGYIGKTVHISLPYPSYKVIPAGTYYLQVIYHQFAVQPPSEAKHIYRDDHTELFRSNVVPITVVDQPPAKLPLHPQKL